jgi:putative sigma-54 modulation protein
MMINHPSMGSKGFAAEEMTQGSRGMQIVTTFRQMASSQALKDYGEAKISKLEKFFSGIIDAKVTYSAAKTSQKAEVTINARGATIRGEESAPDAYAALDLVIDKLSRQLRKLSDKVKGHKDAVSARTISMVEEKKTKKKKAVAKRPIRKERPEIVSVETYALKPLFPDDACLELAASREELLVFINAESNDVNVIFRRRDGNFGLIEPDR